MAEQFTSKLPALPTSSFDAGMPPSIKQIGAGSVIGRTVVTSSGGSGSGGQFTSSVGNNGDMLFGGAVKDSLRKFLDRRDQRILDLALAPGDDNIAQLCWGGLNKNNPRTGSGLNATFSTRKSKDDVPAKPPNDKAYIWTEQERFVVKTKITNPSDAEQFLWVNVCKVMSIVAPSQQPFDGKTHFFKFDGKETVVGTNDGGNIGSESGDSAESAVQKSAGSPTPGPGPNTPTGSGTQGSAAP